MTAALQLPTASLWAQSESPALGGQLDAWYERARRQAPGEWGIAIAD
jgi:hypothetical protein